MGDATMFMDRNTGKIRCLLREERTEQVVEHFYIVNGFPYCHRNQHRGSEESLAWIAFAWSEGEPNTVPSTL